MIIKEIQYATLIVVKDTKDSLFNFDAFGYFTIHGECLLFPSKEIRDWSYFNTFFVRTWDNMTIEERDKVRELLTSKGAKVSDNYLESGNDYFWFIDRIYNRIDYAHIHNKPYGEYILSTGTELKLDEKEKPKFKVGDVVRQREANVLNTLSVVVNKHQRRLYEVEVGFVNRHSKEDGYIAATPEEIAKWNEEVLQPNHLHYSKSKRKIIDWFLPFDKNV